MISFMEDNVIDVMPYMTTVDPLERALLADEEESKDELVEKIEQVLNMPCKYVHRLGRFEQLDKSMALTPPKP